MATGDGFTNTVTWFEMPVQPSAEGVMVKVTVTGFAVGFTKVPLMLPDPLREMVPVTPGLSRVQLKLVPATLLLKVTSVI